LSALSAKKMQALSKASKGPRVAMGGRCRVQSFMSGAFCVGVRMADMSGL
jgi:hypothetical protein